MSNYGEPWKYMGTVYPYSTPQGRPIQSFCLSVQHAKGDWEAIFCRTEEQARRIESCVNACVGFDPQEMRRLAVAMKILENHNAGYAITLRESTESSEADVPTLLNVVSVLAVARKFHWREIEMLEVK